MHRESRSSDGTFFLRMGLIKRHRLVSTIREQSGFVRFKGEM